MIVVTGATGALNGATVDHLLALVGPDEITVAVRDMSKAQRFAEVGIAVRRGDYGEPATLPEAFAGADQVLLVSSSDPGADAVGLHQVAIEAAINAGVGRIVYTSHQGAGIDSPFKPARDHAATEQFLADSGTAWTSLRNGFYAHSLAWLIGPWHETGAIAVPGDGPVSWTAREDEAEAAAIILASNGAYDGPITLATSDSPTFEDVAAICSDLAGTAVERVLMGEDEWVAAQVAQGTPEFMARFTLGIYSAAQEGRFINDDTTLAALLGREPRSARDLLAQASTP